MLRISKQADLKHQKEKNAFKAKINHLKTLTNTYPLLLHSFLIFDRIPRFLRVFLFWC